MSAGEPLLVRLARCAMGTEFEVVLAGDEELALTRAAHQALDEVERLDRQLSRYVPDSDVCWLNAHAGREAVPVEPGLFRLLERAAEIHAASAGAFDVTVGPLVNCWRSARERGALPSPEQIAEALASVGMAHVHLDRRQRTVRLDRPGIELDLGGIGKGYAVDRAVALLRESGVRSALLHGGYSTVYALGPPPRGEAWPVGIGHPSDADGSLLTVHLRDRALSTSGNYEQGFLFEGVRYGHLLDPRTGRPAAGMLSASALTDSALDGDALSTAFFVRGVAATEAYCHAHPEVGAVLVPETGGDRSQETGDGMAASAAVVLLNVAGETAA